MTLGGHSVETSLHSWGTEAQQSHRRSTPVAGSMSEKVDCWVIHVQMPQMSERENEKHMKLVFSHVRVIPSTVYEEEGALKNKP